MPKIIVSNLNIFGTFEHFGIFDIFLFHSYSNLLLLLILIITSNINRSASTINRAFVHEQSEKDNR